MQKKAVKRVRATNEASVRLARISLGYLELFHLPPRQPRPESPGPLAARGPSPPPPPPIVHLLTYQPARTISDPPISASMRPCRAPPTARGLR